METKPAWLTKEREAQLEHVAERVASDVTSAGATYFRAHFELIGFVAFVGHLVDHMDGVLGWLDEELGDQEEKRRPFGEKLDPFRPLLQELVLSRGVDGYLTYVSELLSLVFRNRPETLRSKETVPLDFVLGFETINELQEAIAERKVERLAYRGMAELAEWVRDAMGFELVTDRKRLNDVKRLVERRNLIVHHRGVIDERYVRNCGEADGKVGEKLKLREGAADAVLLLAEAVSDADSRAAEKWGLDREPLDLAPFRERP